MQRQTQKPLVEKEFRKAEWSLVKGRIFDGI